MKARLKKKRAKQSAPPAPRVSKRPPRALSSERARFQREFRGSYVSYDLYRKVQEANKRIKQLERAGVTPAPLVMLRNTLGENLVSLSKNTPFGRIQQIEQVVEKFVKSKWTTVEGAAEIDRERRKNFEKLVRETIGNISRQSMSVLYGYMGDMDIRELLSEYIYDEVMLAAREIDEIGGNVTKSNVKMAIDLGIDYYIEYEIQQRGYNLDNIDNQFIDRDVVIDVARSQGINSAIEFLRQNT